MRLGIQGLMVAGLALLLGTAGVIAAALMIRLVSDEALDEVTAQQRERARAIAAGLSTACAPGAGDCAEQLASTAEQAIHRDLLEVVVVGRRHTVLGGWPVPETARQDPRVARVLQSGVPTWERADRRGSNSDRGPGLDQHVVLPITLADGRGVAVRFLFSLDDTLARIGAQQGRVLMVLAIDLLVVLLFGLYLGRRYVVLPLRALTEAARRVSDGALDPSVVPPVRGGAELEELRDTFAEMLARLGDQRDALVRSEKLATVGRLSAGVAHEIGNPMGAVMGFVEFLREADDIEPAKRQELLARTATELTRIRSTLRQLLDFSRPAKGTPGPVDPCDAARSAVELVRYQTKFRDLTLEVEAAPAPPALVDAAHLQQALVNLLLNAADALVAADGGGRIRVVVAEAEGRIRIDVEDDGPGVSADAAEGLFEPFHTTKPSGQGTGLGLAISRRLMEEAGGTLTLSTAPGEPGARFTVVLPTA